jgi:hypothetical protein
MIRLYRKKKQQHLPTIRHIPDRQLRRKEDFIQQEDERTNSWHNRFRKLLIRYEKKVENYLEWYICLAA